MATTSNKTQSKSTKSKKKSTPQSKKTCSACGKNKVPASFYTVSSDFYKDGKLPFCKDCVKRKCADGGNNVKQDEFINILRQMGKPFLKDMWDATVKDAREKNTDVIGLYLKKLTLRGYKEKTFSDSEFENIPLHEQTPKGYNPFNLKSEYTTDELEELKLKWGDQFTVFEFKKLEKFEKDMLTMNNIETPQEEAYLKKIVITSMKLDEALSNGDTDQAGKLGTLFSNLMRDSKFRSLDKSDADKTGGIRSFSQIYQEVERDDFIPPWEHYRKLKGIGQDIVDKTIMHIENFTLKLHKANKMTEPPYDTPKLESDEADKDSIVEIEDIEVDKELEDLEDESSDELLGDGL